MAQVGRGVLVLCHALYKSTISQLFTGCCRFHPSCSDYMREAIHCHGVARGSFLGLRRLAACRPGGRFGFDPVPPRF